MEPLTETRAALYLRRSNADERDRGGGTNRSIDGQRADLERLAQAHGLTIITEFNEGAGVSASFLSDHDRPEWERALAELGNTYDVLLGWALDRLTREGMGEVARLFDLVEQRGARVLTADGFDTSNEAARYMGGFMAEQARAESSNMSKRVCRGKEGQRLRGEWQGGRLPFGLLGVKHDGKITDVVVDQDRAADMRAAAELVCDGASLGQAAKMLNERGSRTMTGNVWQPNKLARTLRSAHLIGHRKYGGDVYRDDEGNPVIVHEPLMSEALWHRTSRTLESRSKPVAGGRRGVKSPKTLIGWLMECGDCRSGFYRHKNGGGIPYYRCPACSPIHSVRRDMANDHVARAALTYLSSLDPDSAILAEVGRRWMTRFSPEQLGRHEAIQEELGLLRDKAAQLQVAYFERSTMERPVYERLEQRFTGQIDDLENELRTTPKPNADLSPLFDLAQSSDDPDGDIVGKGSAWMALPLHQRRDILRCIVDKVTVERRPRPSDDIEGRLVIEFATEDNVIDLASRTESHFKAHLDLTQEIADLKTA